MAHRVTALAIATVRWSWGVDGEVDLTHDTCPSLTRISKVAEPLAGAETNSLTPRHKAKKRPPSPLIGVFTDASTRALLADRRRTREQ